MTANGKKRLIVGVSGATGSIYAYHMLRQLQQLAEWETHLVMSQAAALTAKQEMNLGQRDFAVHDFRENLLNLSGRSMYVTDVDGNRYDIGKISDLDPGSRAILQRWI